MVLDLETDGMAECSSDEEDYLPRCDCDVNRQEEFDVLMCQ